MVEKVEFNGHVVGTRMGDTGYEAVCTCGWTVRPDENWVIVSTAIVAHFNMHIFDR